MRKFRKKVLMARLSGLETPPEPVAVLTRDMTIQLMQGPTEERNIMRPTLGNQELYHVGPHTGLQFSCEAVGSGVAGTPPLYGLLLRGCGLDETIVQSGEPLAPSSVEYEPVSEEEEAVDLFYYHDGVLHALTGCRGNVTLAMNPGSSPLFQFNFLGLHVDPEDAVMPTVDFSTWPVPVPVTAQNTGDFSLHGYSGNATAFSIDLAQQVVYRNVIGEESIMLSDRRPSGSITVEDPLLSDKDFHAIVKAHTLGALTLRHGTEAGKIVEVSAPQVQLVQPQEGDSDGISTLQMAMRLMPQDGDDEIKIIVR
jgi:hypothetical protein